MPVWIPLNGGDGPDRKRPLSSESGWQLPSYKGGDAAADQWVGLRLDDWIVVDCDSDEARDAWLARIGLGIHHTWVRKTPNGWHFFYHRKLLNLRVQAGKPFPKTDLKLGKGHYVVFHGDGYGDWTGSSEVDAIPFDPSWIPAESERPAIDDWSEMPEGVGDNAMIAFGGTFRRWGMDEATIAKCLAAVNEITMTQDPMPKSSIRRLARSAAKHNPEDTRTVLCPKCANEIEVR